MLRRITVLIPLLLALTMSGCFFFPRDHGYEHDRGRHYDRGGPGYYHR